jgi:hypothetical protein
VSDPQEPSNSTRRELIGATLVAGAAALVVGILWLVSRGAPSATRDPGMALPALVPTPTPKPTLKPTPKPTPTSVATVATPTLRARKRARRLQRQQGTAEAGAAVSP